ncbi:MAG: glycosyltransferase family 4 protein, partial [Patescibacteria group bacterium]
HILPLGTVAYLYFKLAKIPYSVFLHGMDLNYALKTGRKKRIAKKILDNAEHIICANSYVAKNSEVIIDDKNKITIVNPGVEGRITHNAQRIAQIKEEYDLNNRFILLSMGRLVKRKGFDKVIESLPEVLKIFPDSVYVIAGSGEDDAYLKDMAKKLPKDAVIFLGSVSEEEKWAWLNACDAFIMPARNIDGDAEGFGIVYLEANLCGKPVIAGDSGGVRDAVQHELNGLLVDPENVKEISDAIMRLWINKNFRMKLGKHGRERVLKDFGWSEKVNKIYNLLKE